MLSSSTRSTSTRIWPNSHELLLEWCHHPLLYLYFLYACIHLFSSRQNYSTKNFQSKLCWKNNSRRKSRSLVWLADIQYDCYWVSVSSCKVSLCFSPLSTANKRGVTFWWFWSFDCGRMCTCRPPLCSWASPAWWSAILKLPVPAAQAPEQ